MACYRKLVAELRIKLFVGSAMGKNLVGIAIAICLVSGSAAAAANCTTCEVLDRWAEIDICQSLLNCPAFGVSGYTELKSLRGQQVLDRFNSSQAGRPQSLSNLPSNEAGRYWIDQVRQINQKYNSGRTFRGREIRIRRH